MSKFLVASVIAFSPSAFAKVDCKPGNVPYLGVEKFQADLKAQGYTIKKFKTPGNCYEIYGQDPEGKGVEIYFNPANGKIVKKTYLKNK